MPEITTRAANRFDRSSIAQLWRALEAAQGVHRTFPLGEDAEERFLASFDRMLSDEEARFLVACEGERVIGMAACRESSASKLTDDRAIELGRVVVAPDRRGTGAARALIAAAQGFARERGAVALTAAVFTGNDDGFWLHAGFKPYWQMLVRRLDDPSGPV